MSPYACNLCPCPIHREGGVGELSLLPGTPGYDEGEFIPNFNDGYLGNGPDMGAFEDGRMPMEIGVDAYR